MDNLCVKNLTLAVKGTTLVKEASFSLNRGELVVLLGPNGAGKTSLMRGALGMIGPVKGNVTINNQSINKLKPLERAKLISYLPQSRPLAWPNVVKDVIALGRYAYGMKNRKLSGPDKLAIDDAILSCDLTHLQGRHANTLSGGELARMHLARAFAAQSPLLLADEPVAALDPRHQFRIMDLIRRYVDNGGGALIVLHDLSLAAQYADHLIWMKDGEIVSAGTVDDTMTESQIRSIYGVKASVKNLTVQLLGTQK